MKINRKRLVIFLVGISFYFCSLCFAQDIPQELKNLGFTKDTLISYEMEGSEEYFTFYDQAAKEEGATVTFIIENGKIKQTIKGQTAKFIESNS